GLPPRLALVETSGPPQASHSAATTGCALTRTATASCAPRIQPGTAAVAGTTQVCGPGQLASTASREDGASVSQSSRPSSCAAEAATRISPLATSRCLSASRRVTAGRENGSQPRPQTPSVG